MNALSRSDLLAIINDALKHTREVARLRGRLRRMNLSLRRWRGDTWIVVCRTTTLAKLTGVGLGEVSDWIERGGRT